MASERASEQMFLGVSALIFVVSVMATVLWCFSMSTMPGMPMPGGWTLSMTWTRMCNQSWLDLAASFLTMWVLMMVAMMLPSLTPMLRRYRQAIAECRETPIDRLTLIVGMGYFFVWTLIGIVVFPLGIILMEAIVRQPALARAAPFLAGVIVLAVGALQFSEWKARQLARCRRVPGRLQPADTLTAWRYGIHLGLLCSHSCAGMMLVLLVIGVMDLLTMTAVTVAMTAERLAQDAERMARYNGVAISGIGGYLVAQAVLN